MIRISGISRGLRWSVLALLLGVLGWAGSGSAQQPAPAPTPPPPVPDGRLPPPPASANPYLVEPPPFPYACRPPVGPNSVSAFVDRLSSNDAAFEVILGQARILSLKENLDVKGKQEPLIAIGDPTVVDFKLVSPRQIRVTGLRIGATDLSITTADGRTYSFEINVIADLDVLRGRLHCQFPDASIKLTQLRDHVVVEGQARDTAQVHNIIETVTAYLRSIQVSQAIKFSGAPGLPAPVPGGAPPAGATPPTTPPSEVVPTGSGVYPPIAPPGTILPEETVAASSQASIPSPQVINLLRVPGSQQVLLKVRVAELDRTGMRQIGGDFLAVNPATGAIVGSQIGGSTVAASAVATGRLFTGTGETALSSSTTLFGIFQEADFAVFLSALRKNNLLKLLAEPNLVAMNGQQASFLAGGEFPVPVAQPSTGGLAPAISVEFKEFGVRLGFVPFILDGDTIRLTVDPEVSTVDFTLGTVLVPGGTPVPGLDTRKAHTVVELHEGQTLAIAGLIQLSLDGTTTRLPIMGDLPILGPFFSNTTGNRMEKELIVLVTPYLVEPMNACQVPPAPGDEVKEPNDLEFYLLNRIEGRTGVDHRSTVHYDDPLHIVRCYIKAEKEHVHGPFGFCD